MPHTQLMLETMEKSEEKTVENGNHSHTIHEQNVSERFFYTNDHFVMKFPFIYQNIVLSTTCLVPF